MNRSVAALLRHGTIALSALVLTGCEGLAIQDSASLLSPTLHRSEVFGFLAGLGTTFAGFPDLIRLVRNRGRGAPKPTMAGITGLFQLLWIYYGLLIGSRPVIAWNLMGALINLVTVGAYVRFAAGRARQTG